MTAQPTFIEPVLSDQRRQMPEQDCPSSNLDVPDESDRILFWGDDVQDTFYNASPLPEQNIYMAEDEVTGDGMYCFYNLQLSQILMTIKEQAHVPGKNIQKSSINAVRSRTMALFLRAGIRTSGRRHAKVDSPQKTRIAP
jgi:hypothetical protein